MVYEIGMDSCLQQTESVRAPGRARRRRSILLVAAALGLLAVIALLAARRTTPEPPIAFLTPGQFAQAMNPGPFTRFMWRLKNLAGPLWSRLAGKPATLHIDIGLYAIPDGASRQLEINSLLTLE